MKLLPHAARRARICVAILAGLAPPLMSIAQAPQTESNPAESKSAPRMMETIHLTNITSQHDLNDLQNDLRNMLPMAAMYASQTQNVISIRATPEDMATAKKLIAELDRPRKLYRITYTITDFDNGKRAGAHSISPWSWWKARSPWRSMATACQS